MDLKPNTCTLWGNEDFRVLLLPTPESVTSEVVFEVVVDVFYHPITLVVWKELKYLRLTKKRFEMDQSASLLSLRKTLLMLPFERYQQRQK